MSKILTQHSLVVDILLLYTENTLKKINTAF